MGHRSPGGRDRRPTRAEVSGNSPSNAPIILGKGMWACAGGSGRRRRVVDPDESDNGPRLSLAPPARPLVGGPSSTVSPGQGGPTGNSTLHPPPDRETSGTWTRSGTTPGHSDRPPPAMSPRLRRSVCLSTGDTRRHRGATSSLPRTTVGLGEVRVPLIPDPVTNPSPPFGPHPVPPGDPDSQVKVPHGTMSKVLQGPHPRTPAPSEERSRSF